MPQLTFAQLGPEARSLLGPDAAGLDDQLATKLAIAKIREVNPEAANAILADLPGNGLTGFLKGVGSGLSMGLYNPVLQEDEYGPLGAYNMAGNMAGMAGSFGALGSLGVGRGLVSAAMRIPGVGSALGRAIPALGKYVPGALANVREPVKALADLKWAWPARTAIGATIGATNELGRQYLNPEYAAARQDRSAAQSLGGILGQGALWGAGFGVPGAVAEGLLGNAGASAIARVLPRMGINAAVNVPTTIASLGLESAVDNDPQNKLSQPGMLGMASLMGLGTGVLAGIAREPETANFLARQVAAGAPNAAAGAKPSYQANWRAGRAPVAQPALDTPRLVADQQADLVQSVMLAPEANQPPIVMFEQPVGIVTQHGMQYHVGTLDVMDRGPKGNLARLYAKRNKGNTELVIDEQGRRLLVNRASLFDTQRVMNYGGQGIEIPGRYEPMKRIVTDQISGSGHPIDIIALSRELRTAIGVDKITGQWDEIPLDLLPQTQAFLAPPTRGQRVRSSTVMSDQVLDPDQAETKFQTAAERMVDLHFPGLKIQAQAPASTNAFAGVATPATNAFAGIVLPGARPQTAKPKAKPKVKVAATPAPAPVPATAAAAAAAPTKDQALRLRAQGYTYAQIAKMTPAEVAQALTTPATPAAAATAPPTASPAATLSKEQALQLRAQGYSYAEIAKMTPEQAAQLLTPKAAPTPAPTPPPASVPFMITKQMTQDLLAKGFSEAEINAMAPAEAWAHLQETTPLDEVLAKVTASRPAKAKRTRTKAKAKTPNLTAVLPPEIQTTLGIEIPSATPPWNLRAQTLDDLVVPGRTLAEERLAREAAAAHLWFPRGRRKGALPRAGQLRLPFEDVLADR